MWEKLGFEPLTGERFADLERLFGPKGACGGCWCMYWRLARPEFAAGSGEGNRRALLALARRGAAPGLIAYRGAGPVGWVSLGPRDAFPRLERSRVLKRVDSREVWSVVCFYVDRRERRKGLTVKLLRAAARFAAKQGVEVLEGYPVDPRTVSMPSVFAWTGFASAFRRAGFQEVERRSATRPIMRLELGTSRASRGGRSPRGSA